MTPGRWRCSVYTANGSDILVENSLSALQSEIAKIKGLPEPEKSKRQSMRQKDAEYESQQKSDRENQTGDWDPDYWARERKKSVLERMFWQSSPPHPLYGKTAEEKAFSLLRWLL